MRADLYRKYKMIYFGIDLSWFTHVRIAAVRLSLDSLNLFWSFEY